jgi:hypothetical protein
MGASPLCGDRAIRSNSSQKRCQAPFLLRDFRFYPLRLIKIFCVFYRIFLDKKNRM